MLLWIVIGGIFFGAVQDFGSLFASIRHQGKSLGEIIETNVSHRAKLCFTVFAWLVMVLLVAAFTDIVAGTFSGYNAFGEKVPENGSVATASLLFIPLAIAFGLFNRRFNKLILSSVVGIVLLVICIAVGMHLPVFLPKNIWVIVIFAYIFTASVSPVWILLQPRDYLNSFLLYFMIGAAIIGILFVNPQMELYAFSGWKSPGGSLLFPSLFVTVACGAISGFHSLIASGTTSKQLNREGDIKSISYGAMLLECVLAVIALIAVGTASLDSWAAMTPPQIFASGISGLLVQLGLPAMTSNTIILLAISAFALTSLDTATRLGRFLFQELFSDRMEKSFYVLNNMYVATAITIGAAALLTVAGYTKIWDLFGTCNQLVAVPAFLGIACWLKKIGKKYNMLYIPMFFMLITSAAALVVRFCYNIWVLAAGDGSLIVEGVQCLLMIPIFILAAVQTLDGCKVLFKRK